MGDMFATHFLSTWTCLKNMICNKIKTIKTKYFFSTIISLWLRFYILTFKKSKCMWLKVFWWNNEAVHRGWQPSSTPAVLEMLLTSVPVNAFQGDKRSTVQVQSLFSICSCSESSASQHAPLFSPPHRGLYGGGQHSYILVPGLQSRPSHRSAGILLLW